MNFKSVKIINYKYVAVFCIYATLFINAFIVHDSYIALVSAFCGITYTLLAGKGNPLCYIIGLTGSVFYVYLAYKNQLWGNLLLYALYFVPMQIIGFFQWNKNLKQNVYEIVKDMLSLKEKTVLFSVALFISVILTFVFVHYGDSNPLLDSFTTVFSILGMYLTVRRAIEQWFVWAGVNLLSLIMWMFIVVNGTKTYSTVFMWFVYLLLAVYFYFSWKKELFQKS